MAQRGDQPQAILELDAIVDLAKHFGSRIDVYQDGADFYALDEIGQVEATWQAPFKVADFDIPAARRARDWFIRQCAQSGYWPFFSRGMINVKTCA